ncbi:mechanosensitive ion channel family protein [Lentisphaera profundi]|uniref:Mechanosensitive ion channel family protein n=1 Tax=Lentisphaera profundi TaxID=1658616 RepID=A0ABY7VVA4_9BACT|nr:mechanosensitive ion channel family protein [Lentisphaera profundi]WDE96761.1 mechanosensitive ion channel family protein [Lentisphaera profundi]
MKFFTVLLFCFASLTHAEHSSDKILDSLLIMIESKSDRGQIDRYFMEPRADLDLNQFAQVIKRIKEHNIEALTEGPVIYYPINETALYMLETKDGWKFAPSASRNFEDIYQAAFKFSDPEKTMEYYLESILANDYGEALSCIIRGKDNFQYKEGKLPEYAIFALENFAVYITANPLSSLELDSYDVDVLRTYNSSLGEINFVFDRGDWLITSSTSKNLIIDHFGQANINDLSEALPDEVSGMILMLRKMKWLYIIVVLLVGFILQWVLTKVLQQTVLTKFERHGKIISSKKSSKSLCLLSMSLSFYLLIPYVAEPSELLLKSRKVAFVLALIAGIMVISKILDLVMSIFYEKAQGSATKVDDVLIPMVHKVFRFVLYFVGFSFVASNMGVNVTSIIAGLGIGGVALALAAKDTVENVFGSITLLFDRPFEVGDWVVINNVEGTVESIGLRSTRVRTFYCSLVNVPNANLIRANVDNFGRRSYRRIKTNLSVTYDTPPEKIEAFCEGIREIIRNHPHTRKDYYHVYLNQFNASSLDILLYCFLDVSDWAIELRERQRLFLDIIRLANRLGVAFAFPTQSLHMVKPEDLYEPEVSTKVENIQSSYIGARQKANEVIQESGSLRPHPGAINYQAGNEYVVSEKG